MAWLPIDPCILKQDDPHRRKVWYTDDGPLDTGDLLLWLDRAGNVTRFQLSHAKFPTHKEYLVEWQHGRTLRFGEVDAGEGTARFKMSPTVSYRRLDGSGLAPLVDYFTRNAGVLEPRQREAITAALRGKVATAAPSPLNCCEVQRAPLGVSGHNGGTGDGTAATNKSQAAR